MPKFVLVVLPTMENAYHNLKDFVEIAIPVGLISVAAVVEKSGCKAAIIDADAENLTLDETLSRVVEEKPDYVGSTCMTAAMDITGVFYRRLKLLHPGCSVIVGGPHVSALPKETLASCEEIDIVVKGEGEAMIAEVLSGVNVSSTK